MRLHTATTDAKANIVKYKAAATAARAERDRLLNGAECDPGRDETCLGLTILENRARLFEIKAERTESMLPDLTEAARTFAPRARAAAIDLLKAEAEETHAKAAAKLAKAGDMDEGEAHAAAGHMKAVSEAWQRYHNAAQVGHDEPTAILELMEAL